MTDTVAVHAPVKSSGPAGESGDLLDEAERRYPVVFLMRHYGDAALARPVESLDGLMLPLLIVQTHSVPGYTTAPLLPVPDAPPAWATRDLDKVMSGASGGNWAELTGPGPNDLKQPLYAGAAIQSQSGGRLVVLGSLQFATDELLNEPDRELSRRGIFVSRFPGNAEIFQNAVFWASKMDTMLAISPNAMQVSRIRPMSAAALAAWHWGVLIGGLPALVLAAGVVTYLRRRD
jgi:hypothetical protein